MCFPRVYGGLRSIDSTQGIQSASIENQSIHPPISLECERNGLRKGCFVGSVAVKSGQEEESHVYPRTRRIEVSRENYPGGRLVLEFEISTTPQRWHWISGGGFLWRPIQFLCIKLKLKLWGVGTKRLIHFDAPVTITTACAVSVIVKTLNPLRFANLVSNVRPSASVLFYTTLKLVPPRFQVQWLPAWLSTGLLLH